ncbi:MAG: P1 family peptidase [Rhodothermia bacterium]|nr:MAG: P1 family peptidase [Rhodothermia bacterium]
MFRSQLTRSSLQPARVLGAIVLFTFVLLGNRPISANAQDKPRARDLGIPLDGTPGAYNAITDVPGVTVGFSTIIHGEGPLIVGEGPARTGVTAILPRGMNSDPVFAGWYTLNGNGEMTGTTWVEESGFLETPVLITNTFSVGVVRDATIAWLAKHWFADERYWYTYPVVAETYDGGLNDIVGQHVKKEHALEALDSAQSGPVAEGVVGGGTGMNCHGFKCGTGTSSRVFQVNGRTYTLGALVQANYGDRDHLRIAGVPVGREITDLRYIRNTSRQSTDERGSIIVVLATDAPLLPHQLKRVARRIPLGIGRMGGQGTNGSGDIFIAFSTANEGAHARSGVQELEMLPNDQIGPLFNATIEATEEAILNAMVAAETTTGVDGNTSFAIPHDRLRNVLRKYNRLIE